MTLGDPFAVGRFYGSPNNQLFSLEAFRKADQFADATAWQASNLGDDPSTACSRISALNCCVSFCASSISGT
jgi:hypothetical protein